MKLIKKKKSGKTWQKAFVIMIAAIFIISMFPMFLSSSGGNFDEFTQCITSAGAVMYGAYGCSACESQKGLFGNSFEHVDYVECVENEALCIEENITVVPTWIISNKTYVGVLSVDELSRISGCSVS